MRRVVWAFVLTLALPSAVHATGLPDCVSADPTPTFLSGADVERSGAIRLADLYRMLPEWHTVSTDFYLWDGAPGVFSLPEWDGRVLLIDGQPVSITILGYDYLNAVPLDVGQIDSVAVYEGPVLCGAVFAPSGLISIRTRKEEPYLTIGASGAMANETGDPGPYRYTPLETVNIDRSGPKGAAFLAIGDRRLQSRIAVVVDEHHVTDERLLPRVHRLYKGHPPARHFVRGSRVDWRVDDPRWTASLAVGRSRFHHFRFAPTFGSEIPLSTDWRRVGGSGVFRVTPSVAAYYSGEFALFRQYPYPESPEIQVTWRDRRVQAQAGIVVDLARVRLGTGFSAFRNTVRAEQPVIDPVLTGSAWHFLIEARQIDPIRFMAMARTAREEGQVVRSVMSSIGWTPFRGNRLRLDLSAVDLPPYRSVPLLYWGERGFGSPQVPGLAPRLGLPDDHARRLSASFGWQASAFGMVEFSATATLADFRRFPMPMYEMSVVREVDRLLQHLAYLQVKTSLDPAVSGRVTRLATEAVVRPVPALRLHLYYGRTTSTSSEASFEEAWAIVPADRAYGSITFAPLERTSVHARLSLESPSLWPRFEDAAADADSLYSTELPRLALLDVGFTKRFWQDHVLATLLLTNVLNREFRRHPGGAAESISLVARLHVQL